MPSFREIDERAVSTIRDAGAWGIVPTPLEVIAAKLGFKSLAFEGRSDISGAIDHRNKTIFVNKSEALVRQRFTLAHEIGHAVLHPNEDKVDFRNNLVGPSIDIKETEANRFASELLMPSEIFKKAWKERGQDVFRMAAFFGVSHAAAGYKAKNLGLINE